MALIFDIETDGFLDVLTTIHCLNIYDTVKNRHERYDQDHMPTFVGVKSLQDADLIVGHNILGFDIPAIQKLYPSFKYDPTRIIDTMVAAACCWPNLKELDWGLYRKGLLPAPLIGKLNLESFGYRLGIHKGEFGKSTDWSEYTPAMGDYCELDVVVTAKLWERISEKLEAGTVTMAQIRLEQSFYWIIQRQIRHGVKFNQQKALELYGTLNKEREALRSKLAGIIPPFYRRKGQVFTPKRDCKRRAGELLGYVAGAPMQRIELVEFNPISDAHISRLLMARYDWIPQEFVEKDTPAPELKYHYDRLKITAGTSPKIDDEILSRLPYPEAPDLSRFKLIQKRIAQIAEGKEAWLKHMTPKGRIHGAVWPFGTVTGRCNHFKPNLGQVPAVYSPFGKECRGMFEAQFGYKLVGTDADALEACVKAHYLAPYDDGAFIQVVVNGNKADKTDIHNLNAAYLEFAGGNARDDSKTWYYAFLYGAGGDKLGRQAMENEAYKHQEDAPEVLGNKLKKQFVARFPGLSACMDAIKVAAKRGYLMGLDGRRIHVRSIHSSVNTLFQSGGAVIMKKALVLADDMLKAAGLVPFGEGGDDYEFVLNIHDEYQNEVKAKHAELAAGIQAEAIKLAGEFFKLRCPLAGSSDIGDNWAETH